MPTFSPNKGYPIPVVGADTNNWGAILNQMIADVDSNLGGELGKAVGGNTNVTLSTTEAQNILYALTGVLTGNISVLWPATRGLYLVVNQTTGAFTLTLGSTSPGATVTLTQGAFAIVYTDGAGFFSLPNAMNLNVNSLNVALNAIVQGQLSATTLFATGNATANGALFVGGAAEVIGQTTLIGSLILGAADIFAAGTDQGSAAQIVSTTAFIAGGSGGVKLPAAAGGLIVAVGNSPGPSVTLYPAAGGTILYQGTATSGTGGIIIPTATTISCYARNSTTWYCN